MRLMRKGFRRYITSMSPKKRLRTAYAKRIHLQNSLDMIINDFTNNSVLASNPIITTDNGRFVKELIGRVAHCSIYEGMPSEYVSNNSIKISTFAKLYNQCCTNYTQSLYTKLSENSMFRTLVELYMAISNESGQPWVTEKDHRYLANIEQWAAKLN